MNRDDFPMLNQDYIYLNNAATTFKPKVVIDEINDYYTFNNSNINRGVDSFSYKVTNKYEQARENVANFINALKEEIVFTKGTTSSINIVARSLESNINEGDNIIISVIEHHSNFVPWQKLCERKNAKLIVLDVNKDGTIDLESLKKLINNKTKIVAVNHVSNTLGGINKIKEISKLVHNFNSLLLVDGAQALSSLNIDVKDLDVDFYTFSAHKIYGPMGLGILYGKEKILNEMEPVEYGGEMIDSVSIENTTYKKAPYKFEAGTMEISSVLAFSKAIDYLKDVGINKIHEHIFDLRAYLINKLNKIDNIETYNKNNTNSSIVLFNIKGIHSHDIGSLLDKYKIIVRAGHHCAEPFMKYLNVNSTVRISLGLYNTKEEIDKMIEVLKKAGDYIYELY